MVLKKIKKQMIDDQLVKQIDDTTSQLAETAKQIDLDKTTSNIETTNSRIDNLVIPLSPENANIEVTDAHVSIAKNKTFDTVGHRFEEVEKEVSLNKVSATNAFKNTDFSSGNLGWVANGGVFSVDGQEGVLTANGTSASPNFLGGSNGSIFAQGSKIFMSAKVKVPVDTNFIILRLRDTVSGHSIDMQRINAPTADTWIDLKGIVELPSQSVDMKLNILAGYSSAASSNNKIIRFKRGFALDMSKVFGAGREPSIDDLSIMLNKFPDSWFANTTSQLISVKDLHEKQRKVINDFDVQVSGLSREIAEHNFPITNDVINGNFTNGSSGWVANNGTLSTTGVFTANGTATTPNILGGKNGKKYPKGTKFYLAAKVKVPANCNFITLTYRDVPSVITVDAARRNSPKSGEWIELHGIINLPSESTEMQVRILFGFSSTTEANGASMEIKEIFGVDLTSAFGTGNEPTSQEISKTLSKYPNSYFDGTEDQLFNVKEIYSRFEERTTNLKEGVVSFSKAPALRPYTRTSNPVLTKNIVTDRTNPNGVADPFIVFEDGKYHMFFEVVKGTNPNTGEIADEIGHAWSYDAKNWNYTQIVISKEIHGHRSAYPHVFKFAGEWYMLPDVVGNVKLYKATSFPLTWEFQSDLLVGAYVDTNIFEMNGIWFMTTTSLPTNVKLYYNTTDDWRNNNWVLHPLNEIIKESATEAGMRGAGNPIINVSDVILPIQVTPKDSNQYGEYTIWYKLSNMSKTTCDVTRLGLALSGERNGGWNSRAIHHISQVKQKNGNLYAVDGLPDGTGTNYSIGIYEDGEQFIASSSNTLTGSTVAQTWTPIVLGRGAYDTFEMHDRVTKELKVDGGYYEFFVQIGNKDASFRIKSNGTILYTSVLCAGSKILHINSPSTITVEVLTAESGTIDLSKTFIDCRKL